VPKLTREGEGKGAVLDLLVVHEKIFEGYTEEDRVAGGGWRVAYRPDAA